MTDFFKPITMLKACSVCGKPLNGRTITCSMECEAIDVAERRKIQPARDIKNFKLDYSSPQWKEKRQQALDFYGAKCQKCGRTNDLQVHHRSYRFVGNEPMEDLQVLCKWCHARVHGKGV